MNEYTGETSEESTGRPLYPPSEQEASDTGEETSDTGEGKSPEEDPPLTPRSVSTDEGDPPPPPPTKKAPLNNEEE